MIVSVSRRTDIPAYFSDWFFNRLEEGFVMVRNPMNYHQVSKIPLDTQSVDCFVFWTKNPAPMMDRLYQLSQYNYYFLFTVTSYDNSIELNVPRKAGIIETYKKLADTIGGDRVIWRYDPILISNLVTEEYHYKYFDYIASKLQGYTNKCIISFVDNYKKCQRNLKSIGVTPINDALIVKMSEVLSSIAEVHGIRLYSCAENLDLHSVGVHCSRCIDPGLITQLAGKVVAMSKDKFQRDSCGCISSIDIGAYNTCSHNCLYCYASYNLDSVKKNILRHDPASPFLIGGLEQDDKVTVRKMESCFKIQPRLI